MNSATIIHPTTKPPAAGAAARSARCAVAFSARKAMIVDLYHPGQDPRKSWNQPGDDDGVRGGGGWSVMRRSWARGSRDADGAAAAQAGGGSLFSPRRCTCFDRSLAQRHQLRMPSQIAPGTSTDKGGRRPLV